MAREAGTSALAAGCDDGSDPALGRRIRRHLAASVARASARLSIAAIGSLTVGGLALGASTMHLGRPIHAYRALKMWKRSWLSREVLMFSAFSGMAGHVCGILCC